MDDVPFQVVAIINNLLNNKEDIYIRGNYKRRLISIQNAINTAIKKYDDDLYYEYKKKKKCNAQRNKNN